MSDSAHSWWCRPGMMMMVMIMIITLQYIWLYLVLYCIVYDDVIVHTTWHDEIAVF